MIIYHVEVGKSWFIWSFNVKKQLCVDREQMANFLFADEVGEEILDVSVANKMSRWHLCWFVSCSWHVLIHRVSLVIVGLSCGLGGYHSDRARRVGPCQFLIDFRLIIY